MFGNNHLFVLHHPKDQDLLKKQEQAKQEGKKFEEPDQSFEKAQEEIAQNSGLMNYGAVTDRSGGKKSPGNCFNFGNVEKIYTQSSDIWKS